MADDEKRENLAVKAGLLMARKEMEAKSGKASPEKRSTMDQQEFLKNLKKKKQQRKKLDYDIFKLERYTDYTETVDAEAVFEVAKEQLWETPKSIELTNIVFAAHLKLKDYPKATFEYKKAINIDPQNKNTIFNYAWLNFLEGNMSKAMEASLKIIQKGEDTEAFYLLARIFYLQGRKNEAINFIAMALKNDKDFKRTHINFAFLSFIKENIEKAVDIIDKLIENDVKNIPVRLLLAYIYLEKEDIKEYEKEDKILDKILGDDLTKYEPCRAVNKGIYYKKTGDYEESEYHFENAKTYYKDCICAKVESARLAIEQGKYKEVYYEVENALEIDSDFLPLLLEYLRLTYYLRKDADMERTLDKVLSLSEDIVMTIYSKKGDVIKVKLSSIKNRFSETVANLLNKYNDLSPKFRFETAYEMEIYKLCRGMELCETRRLMN